MDILTALLGLLGNHSSGIMVAVVVIFMTFTLFLKRDDQATQINKLQTDQLSVLIKQNTSLAQELNAVRQELTEAYTMINDMRNRIIELEEMQRKHNAKEERLNHATHISINRSDTGI